MVVGVEPDWELFAVAGRLRPQLAERLGWRKVLLQTQAWDRVHNESSIRRWEGVQAEVHPLPPALHYFDDFGLKPHWLRVGVGQLA